MGRYLLNLLLVLVSTSVVYAENPDIPTPEEIAQATWQVRMDFGDLIDEVTSSQREQSLLRSYQHIDPKHWVPTDLLQKALVFFEKYKDRFSNKNYLTIVDFAPRSNEYRLFIINLNDGSVKRFRTTHGEGSDANKDGFAESFGNIPGSKKSSLGYVRTAEVYQGSFGRSLRLDGLSSTNSKIRERAVVFHGWTAVKEANKLQPLSWGCITIDPSYRDGVIDVIKNGSLMLVSVSQN